MMLTVQGQPAYCYTGGRAFDAALPTVVFLHGAQNDHSVWILQSRYFAHHGFSVLAVDLPGHGRSAGPALGSVEALADWLLALLDAAGVATAAGAAGATLIGHSMGSLVALEATAKAPQRVARLALVGTAWPMRVSEALLAAARDEEQVAIDMVNIWSHSTLAQKPSCPGPGFSVTGGSRRLMQQVARRTNADGTPAKVFLTDFQACNAYANGAAAAASVRCPTLLLLGENDQMTPPKASAILRQTIAHHQLVQLADCGHSLMSEQPDAVLGALFRFAGAASAAVA
jgi:pimeloyl-ACP methyl ester carboxylesterase